MLKTEDNFQIYIRFKQLSIFCLDEDELTHCVERRPLDVISPSTRAGIPGLLWNNTEICSSERTSGWHRQQRKLGRA
jgi:hypothetical protein